MSHPYCASSMNHCRNSVSAMRSSVPFWRCSRSILSSRLPRTAAMAFCSARGGILKEISFKSERFRVGWTVSLALPYIWNLTSSDWNWYEIKCLSKFSDILQTAIARATFHPLILIGAINVSPTLPTTVISNSPPLSRVLKYFSSIFLST